jgi:hypothetical protein
MTDPPDDSVTATVRAWATAALAWMGTFNVIGVSWLDMRHVESGNTGFNEETVVIPAQQVPIALHPEGFADWDDHKLPPTAVAVTPSQVYAGQETEVCVSVKPPAGAASGTYTGSLLASPGGAPVVEGIGVYVVGSAL